MNMRLRGVEFVEQLRNCSGMDGARDCVNCPYLDKGCNDELQKDAAVYIRDALFANEVNEASQAAERPVGHWEFGREERALGIMNVRKCSCCGATSLCGSYRRAPKFCEDCGAEMIQECSEDGQERND